LSRPQISNRSFVIKLIRRHAPQAAIAANTNPVISPDAARRWLSS